MRQNGNIFEKATSAIGKFVSDNPIKITIAFLLITSLMILPMTSIEMEANMSSFIPDNKYQESALLVKDEFNATDSVVNIVTADGGDILNREGLLALKTMKAGIMDSEIVKPYLVAYKDPVLSIADVVEGILISNSNGAYGIENAPDQMLENSISSAVSDGRYSLLISYTNDITKPNALMIVTVEHDLLAEDMENEDETLVIGVEEAMEGSAPEGYSVYTPAGWNKDMKENTQKDLGVLLPITLIALLAILLIALRSFADLMISLAGLISTIIISFGLFGLIGLPFNQMTFFAPILIMVLSIDFAIHILMRFKENVGNGFDAKEAMSHAIRFIGISVLLSALTTVVAFASNGFSDIPAVSSFGIFLAMGISVAFLVMMLMVPSMRILAARIGGSVYNLRKDRKGRERIIQTNGNKISLGSRLQRGTGKGMKFLGRLSYSYPLAVLIAAGLLTIGGFAGAMNLEKDMAHTDVLHENSEKIIAVKTLNEQFPGVGMQRVSIIVEGDISDPEILMGIDGMIRNMEDDDHVGQTEAGPSVVSIITYIKIMMSQGTLPEMEDADANLIPDTKQDASFLLSYLYESGIPGRIEPRDIGSILSLGEISGTFDMTRLSIEAYEVQGTKAGELLSELEYDVQPLEAMDGVVIHFAGDVFERDVMLKSMTDGMILSTIISILLCTGMVVLLFWSPKYGIIAAIPVILVTVWVMGSAFLFGFNLNPVTATTTALTVGIGIDYSIHLVERYRQERKKGKKIRESMDSSLMTTGVSLLAAGATTASGFGIISMSRIGMFNAFGTLSFLIIVYVLIASITVLPALIVTSDRIHVHVMNRMPEWLGHLIKGRKIRN